MKDINTLLDNVRDEDYDVADNCLHYYMYYLWALNTPSPPDEFNNRASIRIYILSVISNRCEADEISIWQRLTQSDWGYNDSDKNFLRSLDVFCRYYRFKNKCNFTVPRPELN